MAGRAIPRRSPWLGEGTTRSTMRESGANMVGPQQGGGQRETTLAVRVIRISNDLFAARVVPAQAGTHTPCPRGRWLWVPAFAGTTPSEPAPFHRTRLTP